VTVLTSEASDALESYLERVRRSLGGTSVDADEVERDVREHIDVALDGRTEPVSATGLSAVLERLGSPDQWVPDEEIPLWRRTVRRFSAGPEDWRLAYLCFALVVAGLVAAPLGGLLLWIPAYLLGRAAHESAAARGETLGPRRWLTDLPLLVVALQILGGLLAGPLWIPVIVLTQETDIGQLLFGRDLTEIRQVMTTVALLGASVGLWWMLLAPLAARRPRIVAWLLLPFADGFRSRHAWQLGIAGLVVVALAVLTVTLMA
jgi:hypothetical protein